jgi:hypothetical protein
MPNPFTAETIEEALKERLEFLSRELASNHLEKALAMDATITDGLEGNTPNGQQNPK